MCWHDSDHVVPYLFMWGSLCALQYSDRIYNVRQLLLQCNKPGVEAHDVQLPDCIAAKYCLIHREEQHMVVR